MSEKRYLGDRKHLIKDVGLLPLLKHDGMSNILTGFGTQKDRKNQFEFKDEGRLSVFTRKSMYKDSALTRAMINSVVDDALKKPLCIKHEKSEEIQQIIKDFELFDWFKRAGKEGRQHGGAVILWHINDGQSFDQPVNTEKIKKIEPLLILPKDHLQPLSKDENGRPVEYWINGTKAEFYYTYHQSIQTSVLFHKSRLMLFEGEYCGEENINENNSFKESVIDINKLAILLYEVVVGSVATLADSAVQEVLKLAGLQTDLDAERDQEILEKMLIIAMSKSVVNRLTIDKEDEYQYHSANFTGYKDLESIAKSFASLSSKIPQVKLFGDNPQSSIGAESGTYQENLWYSTTEEYQNDMLESKFSQFFSWVKPFLSINPKDKILYSFDSLRPVDRKTEADADNKEADTFTKYIDKGVLTVDEVRKIVTRKYSIA